MKKYLASISMIALLLPFVSAGAATLSDQVNGRILLQVQAHGEAWYEYPGDGQRYFLGRPSDAFSIMRKLGLGIGEADFSRYKDSVPDRLSGYIVLRVASHGEAYYADPHSRKMIPLGRPADAFLIMREQGLGIADTDLKLLPVSISSIVPPGDTGYWLTKTDSSGNSFRYPPQNDSPYISEISWPPKLSVEIRPYSCSPNESSNGQVSAIEIGGRQFCRTRLLEAAAGSTYATYTYRFAASGDRTAVLSFVIRTVQCANYNDPQQGVCRTVQGAFDPDYLAGQIAQTAVLP